MSYQVSYVQTTNPDVNEQLDHFLNNGLTIPAARTTYLNPLQGSTVLPGGLGGGATIISNPQSLGDLMQATSTGQTFARVVQNEPLILPQTESYEIIQPQQTQTLIEASAPALLQPQTLFQPQQQTQQLIQYPSYINLNNARYKLVSRTQQLYVDTPAAPTATNALPTLISSSGMPANAFRLSSSNQLVLPRLDAGGASLRAPTAYYTLPSSFGATRQMAMSTPALPTVSRRVLLSSLGGQPIATTNQPFGIASAATTTTGAPVIYRL